MQRHLFKNWNWVQLGNGICNHISSKQNAIMDPEIVKAMKLLFTQGKR